MGCDRVPAIDCRCAPDLRPVDVLRAHNAGEDAEAAQTMLTAVRTILGDYQPFAASVKYLLGRRYGPKGWNVRSPLEPLPPEKQKTLVDRLSTLDLSKWIDWI